MKFSDIDEARQFWEQGRTVEERVAAFLFLKAHLVSRETARLIGKALGKYTLSVAESELIGAVLLTLGEETIEYADRCFLGGPVLLKEVEGLVRFVEAYPTPAWREVLTSLQNYQRFALFGERTRLRQATERLALAIDPASKLPLPAMSPREGENLPMPSEQEDIARD